FIGWIAPAVATTLAGWVMVVLLMRGVRPMGDVARFDNRFNIRIWRICATAAVMGLGLWGLSTVLQDALHMAGIRYLALAGLIVASMVIYFGTGHLIGAFRLSDFRKSMRRS
ncbi:MAG: putative peptidoglycan lipid II flippase, partial [Paracoccaceae bacterium]